MKILFSILLLTVLISSCKKNEEKIIGNWQLKQYVEFDSLGDRDYGFSYSEVCPFKYFEVKENTWSKYDEDCNGNQLDVLSGFYEIEEDTLILEGNDVNGQIVQEWYIFRKLNKRKLQMDLVKKKTNGGEWEWVDLRYYSYIK